MNALIVLAGMVGLLAVAAACVVLLACWVAAGEPDVNGDVERDGGK